MWNFSRAVQRDRAPAARWTIRLEQEVTTKREAARIRRERRRTARWFAELDRLSTEPFMKGCRNQPKTPRRRIFR